MKTDSKCAYNAPQQWLLVDAKGKTLGRLASFIANRLRGKHKPAYAPHVDCGDFIVVTNVADIAVTGNKIAAKRYWHHTGFPGGIKNETLEKRLQRAPIKVLEHAVKGMLPKGPLGYRLMKKLKLYAGDAHPHAAQQPIVVTDEAVA